MDILTAAILGVVQGLTEFLPISSDGHLVLADYLLGVELGGRDALGFDILLHGASLLTILLVDRALWVKLLSSPFRRDKEGMRLLLLLAVSIVPAGIAGLLFADVIAGELRSVAYAAAGFAVTAAVLILGERAGRGGSRGMESMTLSRTLLVGCAQAIALLPGVSRSGCTTSAARALGLSREAALRFSFLMVVPAILGALAKTALDVADGSVEFPPLGSSLVGFAASFVVSLGAIAFLRRFVARHSLSWFAWYLLPLALYLLFEVSKLHELVDVAHIEEYVRRYGAIAVFFFALLETVPPISAVSPGVLALVIAGSLASTPETAALFFAAAVSGVACGNIVLFRLGERYGRKMAYRLHLTDERLGKVDALVRRFGRAAVCVAQFVGVARPVMAFVAGTAKMPHGTYYWFMLASAVAWAGWNLLLGYAAKSHLVVVLGIMGAAGYLIPAAAALLLGARGWRRKTRDRGPGDDGSR
jgi:undecaprenyl-diphosphatase